ncbi:putative serine esterase (DUF676) [Carpediemonas membranifera]|uniref:Putative serine esterase (DUF676) n=1 Tax=Carpediemonas membranifera TaxID=201153 RepID=A0A8J6B0H1_9EUKA|nr:putative serine esterase (DUF676) [Carpediemonas membranifera]|eukprot:KAG9395775.1 putative serine esterase (DUF676) [Carpediemonas membranifera]
MRHPNTATLLALSVANLHNSSVMQGQNINIEATTAPCSIYSILLKLISFQNLEIASSGTYRYEIQAFESDRTEIPSNTQLNAGEVALYGKSSVNNEGEYRNYADYPQGVSSVGSTYQSGAFDIKYCDQTVWLDEYARFSVPASPSTRYIVIHVALVRLLSPERPGLIVGRTALFIDTIELMSVVRSPQCANSMASSVVATTLAMPGSACHRLNLVAVPTFSGFHTPYQSPALTPKRSMNPLFGVCSRSNSTDSLDSVANDRPVLHKALYLEKAQADDYISATMHTSSLIEWISAVADLRESCRFVKISTNSPHCIPPDQLFAKLQAQTEVLSQALANLSRAQTHNLVISSIDIEKIGFESTAQLTAFQRHVPEDLFSDCLKQREHVAIGSIMREPFEPGHPIPVLSDSPHIAINPWTSPNVEHVPFMTHKSFWMRNALEYTSLGDCNDLFVCIHGFMGAWSDLLTFRAEIRLHHPSAGFIMARTHSNYTKSDISKQGELVTQELIAQWENRPRVHFITHSMGAPVALRVVERLRELAEIDPTGPAPTILTRLHGIVMLAGPLLGVGLTSSPLMKGAVILSRMQMMPTPSLRQLTLADAQEVNGMFLYHIAKSGSLGFFKHAVFVSVTSDEYVPLKSALLLASDGAGADHEILRKTFIGDLISSETRVDKLILSFPNLATFSHIDRTIGRAAHIKLLDDQVSASMTCRRVMMLLKRSGEVV